MKNCSKLIFVVTGLIAATGRSAVAETGENQSRISCLFGGITRSIGLSFVVPFWFAVMMVVMSVISLVIMRMNEQSEQALMQREYKSGESVGRFIAEGIIYIIIVAFTAFTVACCFQWLFVPGSFK